MFYTHNFKSLASFSFGAGWFASDLFEDPEDSFSRDEAHMYAYNYIVIKHSEIG